MIPTPNTIWHGDNLAVMRAMDDACVDLVYLDPPYDSRRNYKAKSGAFMDTWASSAIEPTGHEVCDAVINTAALTVDKARAAYLSFMAIRLIEIRRILKPTGSVYLHCDPTASHYIKLIMDAVFGHKMFRNEVAWCYKAKEPNGRWFPKKHDVILFYTKTKDYTFNVIRTGVTQVQLDRYNIVKNGKRYASLHGEIVELNMEGPRARDWWDIPIISPIAHERLGYPTQKPIALLDRIIRASSDEGDLVYDPFMGSGTTLDAASRLGRRWIGSDQSIDAVNVAKQRLEVAHGSLLRTEVKVETAAGLQ